MLRTSATLHSRAFVLAIPGIGGSLDLVISSGGQRSEERIHEFLDDMKKDMQERLEAVEDSAIDEEYLQSEEFFDLLMKALDTAIKTRDETKRAYVCSDTHRVHRPLQERRILSRGISRSHSGFDAPRVGRRAGDVQRLFERGGRGPRNRRTRRSQRSLERLAR